jgi:hypothetical protein
MFVVEHHSVSQRLLFSSRLGGFGHVRANTGYEWLILLLPFEHVRNRNYSKPD